MFSRKNKTKPSSTAISSSPSRGQPSVISSEMNVLGNIVSDGVLDIDGQIDGNVKCASLTVRGNGMIRGDVVAETVKIFGAITGMVKARNVILHETAHVDGVIIHESLSVEDGACIDGKFKRMEKVILDDQDVDDIVDDEEENTRIELLDSLRIVQ